MSINEELKDVGLAPRVGLIVYLNNISDQFKLRRYGDIVYFSKNMKYCILYLEKDQAKRIETEISALSFVKKVERSAEDQVDLDSQHLEGQISQMAKKADEELQKRQEEDEDLLN